MAVMQESVVSFIEDVSIPSTNDLSNIIAEELHETVKQAAEVMLKFYTRILDVQVERDSSSAPAENFMQPILPFQVAKILAH